ncbi:hypothetical protein [Catenulispora subtropica]|uniref:Uncharacterized protein n=1 Tax=Catenulispora subtropica TaxID=450798 RepID=A0ABP5DXC1_9ACTN
MVLDDYERDGAAAKTGIPKKDFGDDLTRYYADATAMSRIHGGGGIEAPIGCGKAAGKTVVDGAIIGAPASSAGAVTIPVTLYTGTTPVATALVTADPAGRLTGVTCQPPAAPNLPGADVLAGFYGSVAASATDPEADDKTKALKDEYLAPAFAKFTRPDVDADQALCAEDAMTYWHAVYAPGATTTGAQWYFNSGGTNQVNMSVAVDAAASRVAWVYCFGQLVPPLTPGGAYSDSQVQSFVGDLFNDYAYLLALKPFGADASGMKAYFASDAAYQAAVTGTGAQPLECSATPAVSIGADTATITGDTAVVELTSSPSGHPVTSGALGHMKVTVDLATMRFTSAVCE